MIIEVLEERIKKYSYTQSNEHDCVVWKASCNGRPQLELRKDGKRININKWITLE